MPPSDPVHAASEVVSNAYAADCEPSRRLAAVGCIALGSTDPADLELYAKTLLAVARDLERAEVQIKHAILDAARAGEAGRVAEIVTRWLKCPTLEVLKEVIDIEASARHGSIAQLPSDTGLSPPTMTGPPFGSKSSSAA